MTIPLWLVWVFIGFTVLDAVTSVALVGEPRKPYTAGGSAVAVLLDMILVGLALWLMYA